MTIDLAPRSTGAESVFGPRRSCSRHRNYGLLANSFQQRTQEIGIRFALGAGASQVRRMVVAQAMKLPIAGMVVGIASALGLAKLITSLLFGVQAWDPSVFVGVPILLGIVALVAAWLPARRASQVDPVQALRYE